MTFTDYLRKQEHKTHSVGDLARTVRDDRRWREDASLRECREHLVRSGAPERLQRALDLAWNSYQNALKRAARKRLWPSLQS